jgi:hypothetical protein
MPYESGQLTPEEIEPGPEDIELAQQLVSEGWKSVSGRHRIIRRWTTVHLSIKELIRPELFDTPEVKWLLQTFPHRSPNLRMDERFFPVEEKELTVKQYRAFRLAGGQSA